MRKSEQVIFITLIDFLLQLLFLGLVLWVIYHSFAKQDIPQDIQTFYGGNANSIKALTLLKDLMEQNGIKDAGQIAALKTVDEAGRDKDIQVIEGLVKDLLKHDKANRQQLENFLAGLNGLGKDDIESIGEFDDLLAAALNLLEIKNRTGVEPGEWADLINQSKAKGKSDAPPNIILGETQGFSFAPGSSMLSSDFRKKLESDVVDHIEKAIETYGINLVEVIGHTDGVPVKRGSREMDSSLEYMAGEAFDPSHPPRALQGSNTDLGMLRALEVVKFLRQLHEQGKLAKIDPATGFRAYSSGQLTLVDGRLSDGKSRGDDQARRRIEIRLTRLGESIQEHLQPQGIQGGQ